MAVYPSSSNSSTGNLTQKLRDFGILKSKSGEKEEKPFKILHHPDRPQLLRRPVDTPTEEECGDEIAKWQSASAQEYNSMLNNHQRANTNEVGHRPLRHPQGRVEDARRAPGCYQTPALASLSPQDYSTTTTSSDEANKVQQYYNATKLSYTGQDPGAQLHHNCSQSETAPRQAWPYETRYHPQRQGVGMAMTSQPSSSKPPHHAAAASLPTPAPLFSSIPRYSPPANQRRSPSPALATVTGNNSLAVPKPAGGEYPYTAEEDDDHPVDIEQLVRMEKYRRGFCPFCRRSLGQQRQPLFCPFLDCRRDLRVCLEYPTRQEASKAPPRLAQRRLIDTQPNNRGLTRREAVPNLRVEAPTPTDERKAAPPPAPQGKSRSPSPRGALRTIRPSPQGIYDPSGTTQPPTPERERYKNKPLPPPPTPLRSERRPAPPPSPPKTLSGSISERHQQLYRPRQQQRPPSPPEQSLSVFVSQGIQDLKQLMQDNQPHQIPSQTQAPYSSSVPSTRPAPTQTRYPLPSNTNTAYKTSIPVPTRQAYAQTQAASTSRSAREAAAPAALAKRPLLQPRTSLQVDDKEFLAWKKPEERARFEKELRERGDHAGLYMDIIEQYEEPGGFI